MSIPDDHNDKYHVYYL